MVNSELSIAGEQQKEQKNSQPLLVRIFAHFFSYVLHPLFIPLYVILFLIYVHPSYFSGADPRTKFWLPITVAQLTIFYPVFSVVLLKALGFADSFFLKTQKDRIIPYIISGIFFFWLFMVFKNYPGELHPAVTAFALGIFLTASAALMANIYFKISMHAMGMGGMLGLFLVIMTYNTMLMTWPLSIAFLLTGIVCTSRLIVSDHSVKEIFWGLFLGVICQLVAAVVLL
jgi:hypothetical protein